MLDEVARRRWLDAALDKSASADRALQDLPPESKPDRPAGRWRQAAIGFGLAAAVTLVVALAALILWRTSGVEDDISEAPAASPLTGRLTLASGEVSDGRADIAVGSELRRGSRVVVGTGRAALEVTSGVVALLGDGSELELSRLDTAVLSLTLRRGRLLVDVEPEREGPPLEVATDSGRVRVTGTAFAVEVRGERVRVEVLRGSVELVERGDATRALMFGHASELGGKETVSITDEARDAAQAELDALQLLEGPRPATLAVRSVPSGARVALDGRPMGHTPLTASVRPGHRRLEIAHDGRESVRELIDLGAGTELTRAFELAEATETEESDREKALEGPGARSSRAEASGRRKAGGSAEEQLEIAHAHRAARDWRRAAAAYEDLITRFPASAQARVSFVSLGRIQLEHLGKPAAALRSFEAYLALKSSGPLAQEAAFGKTLALRALGRRSQEAAALERFLNRFPGAIQAERARRRLAELR